MRTEEPRAVRLKDYRPPDYRVREIALDFSLDPDATRVKARMQVERLAADAAPLVLDGERLKLVSIALDGQLLDENEYRLGAETLTIPNPPARFALEVVTEIAPVDQVIERLCTGAQKRLAGWGHTART